MPNWCSTSYVLKGPTQEAARFYDTLHRLETMSEPLVENGFGPNWLGCLVKDLGGDPETVGCRGDWSDLRIDPDNDSGAVVYYSTETAWGRCHEVDDLIAEKFPTLQMFYLAEEEGMDIFCTNDELHEVFPEFIRLDFEDEETDYCDVEEALAALSQHKGSRIGTWEEAVEYMDKVNEEQDNTGGEHHIWYRLADYIEL